MKIGAQFFTVRELCTTLDGLEETLKRVADIGYTSIQLSGVCRYEADWMADKLKQNGLTADLTHFDYNRIINDTAATIAFHDTMNCKYIGIGSNPRGITPEGLEMMKKELCDAIPMIKNSGHKFMYHNHNMEFAKFNNKNFLELLCDSFTPEECGITLDTYWVQAGGADPAYWIRALAGRVDCIHFKDMVYSVEDKNVRMAAVGDGNMNFPVMLDACEDADVKYIFVEQDLCYGEDPISCLKRSYDYLKSLGLS